MIFFKVLTERNCRKTKNKLKTQSVVLLPLIPSKIIYTLCIHSLHISPLVAFHTTYYHQFPANAPFEAHAPIWYMRNETRRLGTSAAHQVSRSHDLAKQDRMPPSD